MFLSIIYDRAIGLMRSSRDWMWKEKSVAAAESGSAAAESMLIRDPGWLAGQGNDPELRFTLDQCDITVRTERFRIPDVVWIFSTGKFRKDRRETVRPVIIEDPTLFAAIGRQSVRLGAGAIVTGSVTAPLVRLEEGCEVVGSVVSERDALVAKKQSEAIIFDSALSPPPFPAVRRPDWTGTGYSVRTGDVTIRNTTETALFLMVTGNLELAGKVIWRAPAGADTPIFFVEKNLTGRLNGSKLRGTIYVRGRVMLTGEGLITGSIIADEIDLSEGVVVESFDAVPNVARPTPAFWTRRVRRIRN